MRFILFINEDNCWCGDLPALGDLGYDKNVPEMLY